MASSVGSYLAAGVAEREQARRRRLLVSIAALTLLGTSPVFGHHLTHGAARLFAGSDHLGVLCLVALHYLLAPVHELFHLLILVGFAYAVWDRVRVWRRARGIVALLDARAPVADDVFWRAACAGGVDPTAVRIVEGLPSPALTVGWLQPRIYVALQLAERLSQAELAAVLAHEGAHATRRDPLRLSVLRFFAHLLFWIPALRRLADDLADETEIQADDSAAGEAPCVLALAIVAAATWPCAHHAREAVPPGMVGFNRHGILERRVLRLAGEEAVGRSHVTRGSIAGAAAALALVWTSGIVMAHPLPEPSRVEGPRSVVAGCVGPEAQSAFERLCERLASCTGDGHMQRQNDAR